MHVRSETRTVYRSLGGRRWYSRAFDAYYDRAKRIIMEKYPAELDSLDCSEECEHERITHLEADQEFSSRDLCDAPRLFGGDIDARIACQRAMKRRVYFFVFEDDGFHPAGWIKSEGKWRAFVTRVARFLRFVDERGPRPDTCQACELDGECHEHPRRLKNPEEMVACQGSDCLPNDHHVKKKYTFRCNRCGALVCGWCTTHCRPSHDCKTAEAA